MTSRSQRAADVQEGGERIVEAAMRYLAEHGYRGVLVEDIANDVGVAAALGTATMAEASWSAR